MLQSIHIQNFRCFEDFKAEGFERINLIGGKNNSGKSCLLEGVYLCLNPNNPHDIASLRNETLDRLVKKESNKNIIFSISKFENKVRTFELTINKNTAVPFSIEFNVDNPNLHNVSFNYITQSKQIPYLDLIKAFDGFAIRKIKAKVIEIIKILDSSIDDITSYASEGNVLFISRINEDYKPITSFGDATNNLIRYFTPIFQKIITESISKSVLLIDEIENGIHYTAHKEFWQHLFKLCKELNVQVFATTHSLEMIKAFNEVALEFEIENPTEKGAYFEMLRTPNNEIKCIKRDSERLEYVIDNGKTFRGE